LQQDFLSDVELYYSNKVVGDKIELDGDEHHHIKDVMRHCVNDEIYVTDGCGNIYETKIVELGKRNLFVEIVSTKSYERNLANITFCIPRLRSADRFEFALEKCVELGITSFIIFDSKRTVAKGEKIERWQKIVTAAMKQSLRPWLPDVSYKKSVEEIKKLDGVKVVFYQQADLLLYTYLEQIHQSPITNHYFIFGPEGGLSEEELRIVPDECICKDIEPDMQADILRIKLTDNRLRSETAIIAAATEISLHLHV
jgi:16S rRNA (uracil1498-N3)-methyltransferase